MWSVLWLRFSGEFSADAVVSDVKGERGREDWAFLIPLPSQKKWQSKT
jgi:hypothetical protein